MLYSFIYNNEVVREAKMVVVDQSDSYLSREFTRRVNATPDVRVVAVSTDMEEALSLIHILLVALLVSSGYASAGRTLTLEECRELAIQNNKELKISGEKIKMAGHFNLFSRDLQLFVVLNSQFTTFLQRQRTPGTCIARRNQ